MPATRFSTSTVSLPPPKSPATSAFPRGLCYMHSFVPNNGSPQAWGPLTHGLPAILCSLAICTPHFMTPSVGGEIQRRAVPADLFLDRRRRIAAVCVIAVSVGRWGAAGAKHRGHHCAIELRCQDTRGVRQGDGQAGSADGPADQPVLGQGRPGFPGLERLLGHDTSPPWPHLCECR